MPITNWPSSFLAFSVTNLAVYQVGHGATHRRFHRIIKSVLHMLYNAKIITFNIKFTVISWISSRLIRTAMVFSERKYNYYFVAELLRHPVYYICGYIARKESVFCENKPPESLPECEFTEKLSRGGLLFPPINLYDFSLYCYAFFKSKSVKCCTKIFLEAFNEIHDFTGYDFKILPVLIAGFATVFSKHL